MSHRHVPPIPDENTHPLKYRWAVIRWRIAVAAVIYPVQVAVALAYGAPPYKARVKAAKKQAAKIEHLKLPLPNCTKIRVQVSRGGK
jgi:hypothetical protein